MKKPKKTKLDETVVLVERIQSNPSLVKKITEAAPSGKNMTLEEAKQWVDSLFSKN